MQVFSPYLREHDSLSHLVPERVELHVLPLLQQSHEVLGIRQVQRADFLELVRLEHAQVLLGHLLHEDRVVALGGHARVRRPEELPEAVDREVALQLQSVIVTPMEVL